MPAFEQALSEYGKAIEKEKPFPALLGAYINGAFRIVVPTNPALAYVRHLDNTPATAYHHNNVDLTLDVTVAANQNKAISLYFDEFDHLAIWGLAPPEAGANLQADPNAGAGGVKAVVAGTNVTVVNTDPTRPIINASGGGGGTYPKRASMFHDEALILVGNPLITPTVLASQLYNFEAYQNPPANGDTFTQSFMARAGTYIFNVLGRTAANRGIVDWYLDSSLILAGQDWYSAGTVDNVVTTTGSIVVATDGLHVLKGVVNGKNGSSTNYFIALTKYWLTQSAD